MDGPTDLVLLGPTDSGANYLERYLMFCVAWISSKAPKDNRLRMDTVCVEHKSIITTLVLGFLVSFL